MSRTNAQLSPDEQPAGARERGFSMVELLVAMVVMAIGLLGAAQMIPLAMAGVTQAGLRTKSVQLAQQRLDQLGAAEYDSVTAGTYSETQDPITLSWTITDDDPLAGTKRVAMEASWPSVRGMQTTNFSTFLTSGQ